ncbi:MAG: peptidylprolyl isomerase [bacterium]|nr:peptidylprolyl isomerase [bacterium]
MEVKNYGIMIAELYPKIAPKTVENFKKLISTKFYDNMIFHRVIKDFMIQTGDPNADGTGGSEKTIKGEFSANGIENKLSHTRGVLSMARRGSNPETEETMNSATSQFFIVHKDSDFLDGNYAAFGKLLYGYDVLDKIANVDTDSSNDKPINPQRLLSIRFVEEGE